MRDLSYLSSLIRCTFAEETRVDVSECVTYVFLVKGRDVVNALLEGHAESRASSSA